TVGWCAATAPGRSGRRRGPGMTAGLPPGGGCRSWRSRRRDCLSGVRRAASGAYRIVVRADGAGNPPHRTIIARLALKRLFVMLAVVLVAVLVTPRAAFAGSPHFVDSTVTATRTVTP